MSDGSIVSIFNDVIGPVMRGPSSSHVAAASRIAALVRRSLSDAPASAVVDFDTNGSLAESHDGHGTDMGFAAGLMGIEMTDPRMLDAESIARSEGVEITFRVLDYGASHPNNYRIEARGTDGATRRWEAISTGGGMIEMTRYGGHDVSISGGWHELLVSMERDSATADVLALLPDDARVSKNEYDILITARDDAPFDDSLLSTIRAIAGVKDAVYLEPILPTHSRRGARAPYRSARELLDRVDAARTDLWRIAAEYESEVGGDSVERVVEKMRGVLDIMRGGIKNALVGTSYADRILGPQAHLIDAGRLIPCDPLNETIKCVTAMMETKSSMGVIVAAPTAGACACLPGTVIGLGRSLDLSDEEMTRALLAAGLIGVFIAEGATFAAEVAGCQVECGAASGMTAAAAAQIMGGSVKTCIDAASIALQNITGLACDPVANRVEVPCLGKNVMGASNAIAAANMALAGFDAVIPLDETIAAIYDIGQKLPLELRCTFGGLGKTAASLKIRERLNGGV